jgi:predicted CXXCH cytochrome family protein
LLTTVIKTTRRPGPPLSLLVALVSAVLLPGFLATTAAAAPASSPALSEEVETCLGCHGDRDLKTRLASGEVLSLYVDRAAFSGSVHGNRLGCLECHPGMASVPHPPKPFRTLRDVTIAYHEQCKRCHFANYTKTLDSVHFSQLARGDARAPVCVDCHSAHSVSRPDVPRSRISGTCAGCHEAISAAYAASVHGRALLEENNGDVPVCTDCHRSHDIRDPRTAGFRRATPDLCGTCHTNEKIMKKYGLSTRVVATYLQDFHGMTTSLGGDGGTTAKGPTAVCTDCHGIHDIMKADAPDSRVMQANLVKTCRQCHADATENFPAAWLSHYEPSWQDTPIVYAVTVFYWIFIPFVLGGLVLQILLHIWRVVVNR